MSSIYNFCAGPGMLPPEVIEHLREDMLHWGNTGCGLLEVSHRTSAYADLKAHTEANLLKLFGLDDQYTILLLQGGASAQFAMLPYNCLREGASADYLVRGYWAEKAAQQAARVARIRRLHDLRDGWRNDAVYAHVTTNETISGTALPENFTKPDVPLCADMSSDILARPRQYRDYVFFYAGAQKNLGVAGLAIVVAEKEFLSKARRNLPAAFCYLEHAKANGLYHTPNTFAVAALRHVTDWLLATGIETVWAQNQRKAEKLYAELDASSFWRPIAPHNERSITNVTFRLPSAELETRFLVEASHQGLLALKGHRSAGGIRVSLYNAMPESGVDKLIAFMREFNQIHG
ncbi:MAG: 3-phosphoserine/phosphohydroxythreonine transaminase [Kiritimatiellae bacterium]|nr:3-phosphoserine/phosphohydroxythreonine transaminase [Kiritimatiellia bacterium]